MDYAGIRGIYLGLEGRDTYTTTTVNNHTCFLFVETNVVQRNDTPKNRSTILLCSYKKPGPNGLVPVGSSVPTVLSGVPGIRLLGIIPAPCLVLSKFWLETQFIPFPVPLKGTEDGLKTHAAAECFPNMCSKTKVWVISQQLPLSEHTSGNVISHMLGASRESYMYCSRTPFADHSFCGYYRGRKEPLPPHR